MSLDSHVRKMVESVVDIRDRTGIFGKGARSHSNIGTTLQRLEKRSRPYYSLIPILVLRGWSVG